MTRPDPLGGSPLLHLATTSREATATIPTVAQLAVAPELAALTILESALQAVSAALLAAQPELLLPVDDEPSTLRASVAAELIEQSGVVRALVNRYRVALLVGPGPDGPLPF